MEVKKGRGNRCFSRFVSLSDRRGQVTIFIIVGIVILFVTAGILFVSKKMLTLKYLGGEGVPGRDQGGVLMKGTNRRHKGSVHASTPKATSR